jgi:hypothetical protein
VHGSTCKGSYEKVDAPRAKKQRVSFQEAVGFNGKVLVNPLLPVTNQDLKDMNPCEEECPFCLAGLMVLKIICDNRAGGLLTPLGGHALSARAQRFGPATEGWMRPHFPSDNRQPSRQSLKGKKRAFPFERCWPAVALQPKRNLPTHGQLTTCTDEIMKLAEKFASYANEAWGAHERDSTATSKKAVLEAIKEFWEQVATNSAEIAWVVEQIGQAGN